MQVLGHRGSRRRPELPVGPAGQQDRWENTVTAVQAALAAGADGVETDVRRSADGALVCHHDPVLADGRPVQQVPAQELLAEGIPLLSDVLAAAGGRATVVCEVKNLPGEPDFDAPKEATAHALVELLWRRRQDGHHDEVVVSSFNWFAVEVARDAGWPTAFLVPPGVGIAGALAYAADARLAALHLPVATVLADPGGVGQVHAAGLTVAAWTVVAVEQATALRTLGVDAVICDDPAAVAAALATG